MGIWLILAAAVALLILFLRVNRRDRLEIDRLLGGNGQDEEVLQAKLEQAWQVYQEALAARDRDLAQKLGQAYYACKTDYEYLTTPPIPLPAEGSLDQAEKLKIQGDIERDNAALRLRLQARNERLLHEDLDGLAIG